jgi:hypothetical protein
VIVSLLLIAVMDIIQSVIGLLPDLPAMPTAVTSPITGFFGIISAPVAVLHFLYGDALFVAIVGLLLVLWNFEWLYHTAIWVWHKLPISSN